MTACFISPEILAELEESVIREIGGHNRPEWLEAQGIDSDPEMNWRKLPRSRAAQVAACSGIDCAVIN